jgi:hypothetical protein
MPALRSTYSSQEEIPETLRQFYDEKLVKLDGKDKTIFALNVSDLPAHPEVRSLHAALSRTKQERDAARKQTTSLLANEGLRQHLLDHGCHPGFVRMATAMLEPQLRIGEDASGWITVTGPGGTSLKDLVAVWIDTEEVGICKTPAGVDPKAAADDKGCDSQRRSNNQPSLRNPWSRHAWNQTLQGRILREDRARADELARQAGHPRALGARFDEAR